VSVLLKIAIVKEWIILYQMPFYSILQFFYFFQCTYCIIFDFISISSLNFYQYYSSLVLLAIFITCCVSIT
jgi:hypothetical protein